MRYLFTSLVVALFVFGVSYANAQTMSVGAYGGYAFESFDQVDSFGGVELDPDINGSWAAGVFFGYGVSDNITVLGDFAYYFAFSPDVDALEDNELAIWTLMGGVKYNFTMNAAFSPYVSGGLGWGNLSTDGFEIPDEDGVFDDSQSGLVARVAGGVDYKLNDQMKAFAEVGYVFTFGDIEDWNFIDVRVGIGYSFQ